MHIKTRYKNFRTPKHVHTTLPPRPSCQMDLTGSHSKSRTNVTCQTNRTSSSSHVDAHQYHVIFSYFFCEEAYTFRRIRQKNETSEKNQASLCYKFTSPCSVPLHKEFPNNDAAQNIQVNVDMAPGDQRKKHFILCRLNGTNQHILAMFVFSLESHNSHHTTLFCYSRH